MDPDDVVKRVIETFESWGEAKALLVDRSRKQPRYVYVVEFYDKLIFHNHDEDEIQETRHFSRLYYNTGWIKSTELRVRPRKPREGRYIIPHEGLDDLFISEDLVALEIQYVYEFCQNIFVQSVDKLGISKVPKMKEFENLTIDEMVESPAIKKKFSLEDQAEVILRLAAQSIESIKKNGISIGSEKQPGKMDIDEFIRNYKDSGWEEVNVSYSSNVKPAKRE